MILGFVILLLILRVCYSIAEMWLERDWPRSTWRGLLVSLFLLGMCASVFGQTAVRVDVPIQTSGPNVPIVGGALPQALWVANASVALCQHPQSTYAGCVSHPLTTYTDSTLGTACPTASPLVELPGSSCTSSTGTTSNLGFWYNSSAGSIDYYVVSVYGTYGPFTITPGVSSSSGLLPGGPYYSLQFCNGGSACNTTGGTFGGASSLLTDASGDVISTGEATFNSYNNIALYSVPPPTANFTATATGSGVLTGFYEYLVDFVTSAGEGFVTTNSVASASPAGQQVQLSGIPTSTNPNVIARNIYRSTSGGTQVNAAFVATINDNTTTTYLDNLPDGSLGNPAPWASNVFATITANPAFQTGGATPGILFRSGQLSVELGLNDGGGILGYAQTGVGAQAGWLMNGAYRNSWLGADALLACTNCVGNTAVGVHACDGITTSAENECFGYSSGQGITTGVYNVAIGPGSDNVSAGANDDIAIGLNTCFSCTGNDNVAIGQYSQEYASGGSQNVTVGALTGTGGGTHMTGSDNNLYGYNSGHSITTGSNNDLFGDSTALAAGSDSNEGAFGHGVTGAGPNTDTIGNSSVTDVYLGSASGLATVHAGKIALPSARSGTFVCTNAGTITISNTNMLSTSNVIISMSAQGGTITTPPAFKTVTGGTGFTVLCGATDTSTYNYLILN